LERNTCHLLDSGKMLRLHAPTGEPLAHCTLGHANKDGEVFLFQGFVAKVGGELFHKSQSLVGLKYERNSGTQVSVRTHPAAGGRLTSTQWSGHPHG